MKIYSNMFQFVLLLLRDWRDWQRFTISEAVSRNHFQYLSNLSRILGLSRLILQF